MENKTKFMEAFQKGGTKDKRIKSDKIDQINTAVFYGLKNTPKFFKDIQSSNDIIRGSLSQGNVILVWLLSIRFLISNDV